MESERKLVVDYGKEMINRGLTTGSGGNISILNKEKGLFAISPSGINYFKIEPGDVVIVNLNGEIVDGKRKPSSELGLHRIFYKNREDVKAIVHTHSVYATTIASLNWEIPAVHYLVAFSGKKVPCANYATFGTKELAENAYLATGKEYDVTLLANHGLLALGNSIEDAFNKADVIEFMAEVYYRTKAVGEPVILPEEEMELMEEKFKSYGQ